jgi:hypothetical protein
VGEKGEVALGGGSGGASSRPYLLCFAFFVNITGNIVNRNIRGLF